MKRIKHIVRSIPLLGSMFVRFYVWMAKRRFSESGRYWENRYESGGNSGDGSYGALATFKAEILNKFVHDNAIHTVIEFGCGDGNQLQLANYPSYLGFDVSNNAIDICQKKFHDDDHKSFSLVNEYNDEDADLSLSLDVVFHLVENDVFDQYMTTLFDAGLKFVIIYASDTNEQDKPQLPHVFHRKFTDWVKLNKREWSLQQVINNRFPYDHMSGLGSPSKFFVYERKAPQ